MRHLWLAKAFVLAPAFLLVPHYGYAQVAATGVDAAQQALDEHANAHESAWKHEIENDLIAEKFDDLDRMADHYRRDKTRVTGGGWRLAMFYDALDAPQQTDKDSMDHIEHLTNWMKARPESITARVALAESLHRWAWVARGNGTANAVTADGWRLFDMRIKESQVVLEGSANLKTMCPQYYSEMLGVGLAQNWDEKRMMATFERGIQLEPEYHYLYKQMVNYLLPKWDGQPGDSAAFAKESADNVGGDAGDMLYFQLAGVMVKRGNGRSFSLQGIDWQRIQHGYRVMATQYGVSHKEQNELAFMAYKFNDVDVARQQFAAIGDDWTRGVWKDKKFFDRIRDWSQGVGA
jgi:hypothetical protein